MVSHPTTKPVNNLLSALICLQDAHYFEYSVIHCHCCLLDILVNMPTFGSHANLNFVFQNAQNILLSTNEIDVIV